MATRAARGGALVVLTVLLQTCKVGPTEPPATYLAFRVQPEHTTAGQTIAPAVTVAARDADGKIVAGFRDSVTLTIGANPAGGALSGTTTVVAVDGVATFSTLSIDRASTGYRLAAASGALATATSSRFDVLGGAATQLVFTVPPATTSAGKSFSPSLKVTARDALGNTAESFTGDVTLTITGGTGNGGAALLGVTTVAAAAGVATFTGVSIDLVGTGYTLSATATGLTGATSAAFDITPGSTGVLAFTAQPTSAIAGDPITPAVVVVARDTFGNTATGYIGNVTVELTLGTGTDGANLRGTRTVAAVAGVATFTTLNVNRSGTGYTLSVRASGLTGATSAAFDIAAGAVTQLVFSVQPATSTAGVTIAPPVEVAAQDSLGNNSSSFTDPVTLTIGTNPGGGTLSGTTTVNAALGVATFSDLSIDLGGTGYRLVATAGALSKTSSAFSINGGVATHLAFTVQPTTAAATVSISPTIRVAGLDAFGNTAPSFTGSVTLTIGTNPAGGILSGTTTVTAVNGVAVFPGLSIDKAGNGYTLSAASAGMSAVTSDPFDIFPESATRLAFTAQPSDAIAGEAISPAVMVVVQDAQGNTVTDFTGNVTVELTAGTGTPGANLLGTRTVAAAAGVATFSTLSVNRSGTGYTLSARSSGLTGAVSLPFDIAAGAVSQLVFTVQPVTTTAGATITPAVQVTAQDSLGNTVPSFTANVTMTIGANPGGGTLLGTTTRAAVAGVAAFSNLSIDKAETGYRLVATSGSLNKTSNAFSITPGTATRLAFTVQPTSVAAGASISPSVRVAAQDGFGNTATSFVGSVTIAIGTNPSGGVLSGTTVVTAAGGVAVFSGLSIDKVGNGYTLRATASGLTAATSTTFNISAASATQLAFTAQPSNTTAGAPISPAVRVTARDAQGNPASSFIGNVTLVITGGTGTAGATLSGTRTVAAVAGVATFSDLSINRSGTGYTLTATASGLTGAFSAAFNITSGPAIVLVFTTQPNDAVAGVSIAPPVLVTARDALGNTATAFTSNVTVAITAGTGTAGATLSGTKTVAAAAGVASFSTLRIDKSGSGYKLTATSGSLTPDTSASFTINPAAATQLAFTVEPTSTGAGASISPSVRVAAHDAFGNTATSFIGNVTIAIGTNPVGGVLSGTTVVAAASGVAVFSGLSIDKVANGYTLRATASGLTAATSTTFDITAASATQLAFTVQPSTTTAGATITPAIQVTARDAQGNTATGFIGNVTLVITGGTGTPGATLSGTRTIAAVAGVASFSTLNIDKSGTGYTLTATASGLTGAFSAAFNITSGTATVLVITTQPNDAVAGTAIAPPVQVTARDALGNTATGFTGNVTVAIVAGTGTAGATLSGTKTIAAAAGVANFSTLSIDKSGSGYKLAATSGSLTPDTSASFTINPGAATRLGFTVQPTTTAAGSSITPSVRVAGLDAFGNTATSFIGNVTIAIGTNPAGGTLSGTTTVAAASGVAVFSGLNIDNVGTGYTLGATSGALTAATSAAFDITASSATQLAFTAQPSTTVAGATITPTIQVTARDAQGNTATGFIGNVTLVITGGTGTPGATLSGTRTVAAIAGVASFSTLNIDKVGNGYTLTATASGLNGTISTAFNIIPGAASQLFFTVQPATTTAGATITPAVEVTARDALGNTATGFTGNVTMTIGANPVGGTLSGTTIVAAVNGLAVFSTLSIDLVGTGYRLLASASGPSSATSNAFSIQ